MLTLLALFVRDSDNREASPIEGSFPSAWAHVPLRALRLRDKRASFASQPEMSTSMSTPTRGIQLKSPLNQSSTNKIRVLSWH
jgi:hypothetical protein